MDKRISGLRVDFNSPVILSFVLICVAVLILGIITRGTTNTMFFSVYRSSLLDPLTYVRFVGHVFGHANWSHLIGNMMLLLVVGPLLEEKYGSLDLIFVILATALVTGVVHCIVSPNQLLGASGVVFAFIVLSSFTSIEKGTIPLTLILVVVLYIGEQVYQGIFVQDNVSNLTHILGGLVGLVMGFLLNRS